MSDCWAVMALPADADERSIKRQYARLLKVTRPDEDPEGFQRLREAYEQVLQMARHRDQSVEPDELDITVELHERVMSEHLVALSPWQALVDQTTVGNLYEQHLQAQALNCTEDFEAGLLQRCFADPEGEAQLLLSATRQLKWLTPWQKVPMDGEQEVRLTQILLHVHQPPLQAQLQAGEESGVIDALQVLQQEPWLASLERSEHLQRWVMIMLHDTVGWSAALFEQVCTLFTWDVKKDLHPEPDFIWQRLLERCEEEDFARHMHRLLGRKPFSAEGRAVHLLLGDFSPVERKRMARAVDDNVRVVCRQLVEQLTLRYPDVLEQFPHADLESWKRLHESFSREARRCLGLAVLPVALLFWLSLSFQSDQDQALLLFLYITLMTVGYVGYLFMWCPLCDTVETLDEWLSLRLLPDAFSGPKVNAKVLKHGIPLAVAGGVMVWAGGVLGLALHSLATLMWIAFAPYRYPQPYIAIRRMFEGRKALLGTLIVGFVAMLKPGGTRAQLAASRGSYQSDCSEDNLKRTMSEVCRAAADSKACIETEWAKKIQACGFVAELVKKTMEVKARTEQRPK